MLQQQQKSTGAYSVILKFEKCASCVITWCGVRGEEAETGTPSQLRSSAFYRVYRTFLMDKHLSLFSECILFSSSKACLFFLTYKPTHSNSAVRLDLTANLWGGRAYLCGNMCTHAHRSPGSFSAVIPPAPSVWVFCFVWERVKRSHCYGTWQVG